MGKFSAKMVSTSHYSIFFLLLFPSSILSQSPSNFWWSSLQELGSLCETDHDSIGQHLGCSCSRYMDIDVMLKADCSNKWIGYNDTLIMPPSMKISRHVRFLDLSRNHLTSLTPSTFGDCEAVQILQVTDNNLQTFSGVNCPRLLKLDLSRNHLKNLTALSLSFTPRLVELDLSFNELLFLEPTAFEGLKNLRSLKMASNQLGMELFYSEEYMLSLKNLEALEELDLTNSSLPDFPKYLINGTTHLKKLSLKDNLIQFIESGVFDQMEELEQLDLSGNLFEVIEPNMFLGLKSLHMLVLDKMRTLTSIREHAFSGLTKLHELSCQMNYYLTYIDSQAFRGDPSLFPVSEEDTEVAAHKLDSNPKIVRLGDNDLRSIDYPLLHWETIDILELHRNSWVCDCNLQWVSDFYLHKPKEARILGDSYFTCYEPHIFAGVPVVAVNPEEMLCFSPAATVAGTIGIVIFGILLLSFCSVIILNQMGMLPDWVRQYNIFGSGSNLPTYTRVQPRPNTKARRMVERIQGIPELHSYNSNHGGGAAATNNNIASGGILNKLPLRGGQGTSGSTEPIMDELEWDNADIGRT